MERTVIILIFLMFGGSINSCADTNHRKVEDEDIQKVKKQKAILTKIDELGLDPSNVFFSDTINSRNAIMIESLSDLRSALELEIYIQSNMALDDNVSGGTDTDKFSMSKPKFNKK